MKNLRDTFTQPLNIEKSVILLYNFLVENETSMEGVTKCQS